MFKKSSPPSADAAIEDIIILTLASEPFFQSALDKLEKKFNDRTRRETAIEIINRIGQISDKSGISQMKVAEHLYKSKNSPQTTPKLTNNI